MFFSLFSLQYTLELFLLFCFYIFNKLNLIIIIVMQVFSLNTHPFCLSVFIVLQLKANWLPTIFHGLLVKVYKQMCSQQTRNAVISVKDFDLEPEAVILFMKPHLTFLHGFMLLYASGLLRQFFFCFFLVFSHQSAWLFLYISGFC